MMTKLRPFAVAPVAALAVGLGAAGVAQASDASLQATVRTAIPRIQHTQAKVLNGLATYEKTHSSTMLVKAITTQDAALKSLQTKVSRDSGSTAAGRAGRTDIIRGLRLIIGSNGALAKDLKGGTGLTGTAAKGVIARAKAGNLDLEKGLKLLKV